MVRFQHPDRLGTKVITNNQAKTSFEQSTLPFGTALDVETSGTTNQRFTSYDRSTVAQLDYAVNRSYSSGQGRFTSVDPIGMRAANLTNPQSIASNQDARNYLLGYADTDRFNPYQDLKGFFGHFFLELIGNKIKKIF